MAFFEANAGNNVFKQGEADGDNDYLASNPANWGQTSQVSTDADTGTTTITEMSFSNPLVTTFDKLINTGTYIWVGSTTDAFNGVDAFAVWRAKDGSADCGISQSSGDVPITDAANQKGKLRIESGTYQIKSNLKVGANGGTAQLEMTGGALTTTGDFRVASNGNNATGTVKIGGGAATVGGMVALATESGGAAEMTIANATVAATGIAYIGRSGGTGTLTVNKGGTFSTQGDISIGSNGGGSHGKLIVDGGDVLGKYWLATGRDKATNTAEIEVKSGNLKIGQFDNTNAMIDLSDTSGTTTTFKQSGGYVYAPGSGNSGDKGVALALSNSDGGTATYKMTGGTLELGGVIDVGRYGNGTFEMSGGTVTAGKYMRLGYGANSVANVYITGGELTAGGSTDNKNYYGLMLADSASSTATFTIDGGTATFTEDSNVGWNGSGTLNIGGMGKVSIGSAAANKWLFMNRQAAATGKSVINLSGNGTLEICHVRLDNGTGEINFDGGTIHAYANNSYCGGQVIGASENLTVNVKAGGATFDVTNGVAVSIAEPLLGDAESTGGGLTKTGLGVLTLAGGDTYTGATTVEGGVLRLGANTTYGAATIERGVLSFAAGQTFNGALAIAKGGAIAIDISGAIDASTVAAGDTVTLLTAQSLTLEEGDSLADAVFLAGPAIEYTLAFENGALVATITDVSHASSTRKVTAFTVEDGTIDQDYNWSNGMPANASYDTVVFCNNATMSVWANAWGDGNNRACQTMAIRDATVLAQQFANWNPCLDKNRIVGNGTLQLRRLGLERRNAPESTVTVGENITVEIVQTANNADTWLSSSTINGNLRVTTGYTIFNSDIIVNGNATFTGEGQDSYVKSSTATGNTFNGDFIMEGGIFDFNSAVATFGENARLVLAGGTVSNYANNIGMTNIVVNGGLYDYTALPGVGGEDFRCSLEAGGTVEFVAAADGTITATGLVAAGGKVVIDASAMSLSEGSTIDLSQIALADGAAFGEDVKVQIAGTSFDWTVAGTTATAVTPGGDNKWIGPAGGDWHEISNWKYGIPTASQTVEIDADTVITYSVNYETKQMPVGTLKLVNGATFTIKAVRYDGGIYNRIVVGAVEGTGTIVLDRAGLATSAAVTIPATVAVTAVNNNSNDSWIEGNGGTLTIEGPVRAVNRLCTHYTVVINGDVTVSGKLECIGTLTLAGAVAGAGELLNNGKLYFSGTMADFTGTVTLNNNDSWFYGNCTGAANAAWNVNSDMHFESTSNTETPATFYMGSIAISANKRFYLPNAATMALYIGSGYMRGVHFGDSNWWQGAKVANLSIHKTGTDELVSSAYGCPNWVVEAGSLVFETLSGTWHTGNSDDGIYFNYGNKEIDSILVKSGAAFGGSTGLTVNNGAIVFESGAILRQTLTREGEEGAYTYSCPAFAATGAVNVDGVVCELVDTFEYLANATSEDDTVFTLLTATSVTGAPTGSIAMDTANWAWMPKVSNGNALTVKARNTLPGMILMVK